MTDATVRTRSPLRLGSNRINRFYRGGALLERFRGASAPSDGDRPEDWVGSVTKPWGSPAGTGLSALEDGTPLVDLLRDDPVGLLGAEAAARNPTTTGLLVKLLDSAIRLPIHCHPTRAFAGRVLGSSFGKAEAWIVLATRRIPGEPAPRVGIGFRDGVTRSQLHRWIEGQDAAAMLAALDTTEVAAGDVVFVPPGRPHAIGAGVFMVEVQEPTDFSIVTEIAGFPIDADDASLGLGWDTMLDAIDRAPLAGGIASLLRRSPEAGAGGPLHRTQLLPPEAAPFFRAERIRVEGRALFPDDGGCSVLVAASGAGTLIGPAGATDLTAGDTLFVPAAAAAALEIEGRALALIACRPPRPELLPGAPSPR
jgi:mannose-6-phosphate isomerase